MFPILKFYGILKLIVYMMSKDAGKKASLAYREGDHRRWWRDIRGILIKMKKNPPVCFADSPL